MTSHPADIPPDDPNAVYALYSKLLAGLPDSEVRAIVHAALPKSHDRKIFDVITEGVGSEALRRVAARTITRIKVGRPPSIPQIAPQSGVQETRRDTDDYGADFLLVEAPKGRPPVKTEPPPEPTIYSIVRGRIILPCLALVLLSGCSSSTTNVYEGSKDAGVDADTLPSCTPDLQEMCPPMAGFPNVAADICTEQNIPSDTVCKATRIASEGDAAALFCVYCKSFTDSGTEAAPDPFACPDTGLVACSYQDVRFDCATMQTIVCGPSEMWPCPSVCCTADGGCHK